jgi:hypothetical protein
MEKNPLDLPTAGVPPALLQSLPLGAYTRAAVFSRLRNTDGVPEALPSKKL